MKYQGLGVRVLVPGGRGKILRGAGKRGDAQNDRLRVQAPGASGQELEVGSELAEARLRAGFVVSPAEGPNCTAGLREGRWV